MFGLRDADIETIVAVIRQEKSIHQALVFGSRAKGNYRPASDIDIVLKGDDVDHGVAARISSILNDDGLLPYKFDVLHYSSIGNKELISHIDRVGKVLFERKR